MDLKAIPTIQPKMPSSLRMGETRCTVMGSFILSTDVHLRTACNLLICYTPYP